MYRDEESWEYYVAKFRGPSGENQRRRGQLPRYKKPRCCLRWCCRTALVPSWSKAPIALVFMVGRCSWAIPEVNKIFGSWGPKIQDAQWQTSQFCGTIYPRWPLWHPRCMLLPSEVKQSRTHSADWAMNLALWTVPWIKPNQPKRVMETATTPGATDGRDPTRDAEGVINADDFSALGHQHP